MAARVNIPVRLMCISALITWLCVVGGNKWIAGPGGYYMLPGTSISYSAESSPALRWTVLQSWPRLPSPMTILHSGWG